ncbi:DUF1360 domain-containing protein [Ectobacillus funiculus]|uniref:DUF1360 domain-containing protein n=1 Tax=Ectobacillus funiculus TaxID=137993 RepID=A0ABV5WQU4_9BACI
MVMNNWFLFVLFALASFRLTRLIVYDKITKFIRNPFIEEVDVQDEDGSVVTYVRIKGRGLRKWIGELLSCYWCTGIWTTAFLMALYYFMPKFTEWLLFLLGIAGVAAIIETVVSRLINDEN